MRIWKGIALQLFSFGVRMKVTSLDTSKFFKPQIVMLVVVGVASVLSGIAPASRAVWFTEMVWAWGLVAILILTYRRVR